MRAKDFVTEVFNQPYKGKWEKSESGSYDVIVRLPDGTPLSIMFNNEGNDEWQVEFYRNNSQEVTGEGDAQRIFATVLTAIQQFIKKHKPWRLIFSASKDVEPGQNIESRAKLYDRLVQRYAAAWGYDAYNEDHGDQVTYELTRLQNEAADLDEMAGKIHGGIRKALIDRGYKYLGGGIDKQAYLEPNGQVYIVFGYRQGHYLDFSPDQKMFVNWINYCNKNSDNPHLPKFSGFESFEFQGRKYIQARMETLHELPDEISHLVGGIQDAVKKINKNNIDKAFEVIADYAEVEAPSFYTLEKTIELLGGPEQAKNLLKTIKIVKQFASQNNYSLDLHSGNYMQRPDGTIVVNDPYVLFERNL